MDKNTTLIFVLEWNTIIQTKYLSPEFDKNKSSLEFGQKCNTTIRTKIQHNNSDKNATQQFGQKCNTTIRTKLQHNNSDKNKGPKIWKKSTLKFEQKDKHKKSSKNVALQFGQKNATFEFGQKRNTKYRINYLEPRCRSDAAGNFWKIKTIFIVCHCCKDVINTRGVDFYYCLFVCLFNVRPSDFEVYLRLDMALGACCRPFYQVTYELSYYIHLAYGYSKSLIPCEESNPGPNSRESSAITTRPWRKPHIIYKYI